MRCTFATLLIGCLFASAVAAADETDQWVRIHSGSSGAELADMEVRGRLDDYGSFQWGRLDRAQIEKLRKSGLDVTIEVNPFELRLGGRSFDPLRSVANAGARTADPAGDFHLVQFDGPIRSEWLRALRARGIELVQPLHPFSYIVWAPSTSMAAARDEPNVRWTGLMRSEWKLPPAQRFTQPGERATMALASAHFDADRLREALGRFGRVHAVTTLSRHYRIVHMQADGRDYPAIAELPGILTVQYIRPEAGPRGEMTNQSIVGGLDDSGQILPGYADWLSNTGYDGSGITVGIVDGRVLTTHEDLADRIAPCTGSNGSCASASVDDHGTHVAGAVAGTAATETVDGNGFLRGQGVAPGAGIVTQVYDPFLGAGPGSMVPDGMLKIYQDAAHSGALLTNNSWGPTVSPQGYDIPTQQIDFISRDADPDTPGNQPVLAVWSIMNGGGDAGGACAPSSLGSPDEAKNLFAVGSTSLQFGNGEQRPDIFSVSSNSAHGPACDGRRVPHIVAPGCNTDSTFSSSNTAHAVSGFCGTSMASPVVSGSVAVWMQKYIDETGATPSPALVKTVFTAAARNLQGGTNADGGPLGHRPDRFQGYGRLDFDTVMNPGTDVFTQDQEVVFDAVGQEWSQAFEAVDPEQPIRIMLAWTDAPGPAMGDSTPAWVNNLDLSVIANGQAYLGNVFGSDGWSTPGGTADGMNNLEGVFLSPLHSAEQFAIEVSATDLPGDALNPYDPGNPSQDFALACYNCMAIDPTFSVSVSTETIEICIPDSGANQYQTALDLGALGPYSGQVELTTTGLPAGSTGTFTSENISPPGSSDWTLDVSASTQPGFYTVMLNGDDGQSERSAELDLNMEAYLDSGPVLLGPMDGEESRTLAPEFTWEALPGTSQYRVQIATDAAFENIIANGVVSGVSYTPSAELEMGASYYWRVQGLNNCGGGQWSEIRGLTTLLFSDRFENVPAN